MVALYSGQPGVSPNNMMPEITPISGVISGDSDDTLTGTSVTNRTQAQ